MVQAADDLRDYRAEGPAVETQQLVDALVETGVEGATVLDIGAGVGSLFLELLDAGATSATDVDASRSYLDAARDEARRRGMVDRVTFHYGDFVELAPEIEPADVVALDRVICCYPEMERLVSLSAARAQRLYGLVYPVDTWWLRWSSAALNLVDRLLRRHHRFFVHRQAALDAAIREAGLERFFTARSGMWRVAAYRRLAVTSSAAAAR